MFLLFAIVCLSLRLIYISHFRVDSDEPQHLHVVWGWAHGLTDYRDFFDNHTPLFHILYAPVLRCFGAQPDILVLMRFTLLPLYLFGAFCVYGLGRFLFNRRVAMWGALFSSLYPYYFFPSIEFRADNLWGPLWFFTLFVLMAGPLSAPRCLQIGLLFGALCTTSIKTVLLLVAFGLATVVTYLVSRQFRVRYPISSLAHKAIVVAAGAMAIPAVLIVYLWRRHALGQFVSCVIQHNLTPGTLRTHVSVLGATVAIAIVILLFAVAKRIIARAPNEIQGAKQLLIALTVIIYLALVRTCVLQVTRQDLIPADPLMILLLTPLLLAILQNSLRRMPCTSLVLVRPIAAALLGVVAVVWILLGRPIFHNGTVGNVRYVGEVLRLTGPDDYVMDYKGESIFRRRPYYFVLEPVTRMRIHAGLIADNIPERLISTGTYVVIRDTNRLTERTVQFFKANYLPVGQVCVAGKILAPDAATGSCEFDLPLAGQYAVTAEHSNATGTLDGTEYNGPRALSAGRHTFQLAGNLQPLAIIWSRAIEKGFSPFNPPPFIRVESEF